MSNQESRLSIVIDSKDAEKNIKKLREALKGIGKESIDAGSGLELLVDAVKKLEPLGSILEAAARASGNLSGRLDVASRSAQNLRQDTERLNRAQRESDEALERLNRQTRQATDELARLNREQNNSDDALRRMRHETEQAAQELDRLRREADEARRRIDELGRDADRTSRRISSLDRAIESFNNSMSGLRNGALVAGTALTGMLYATTGAAMDFESAMADVKKVVDFDTPDGLQKMNDDLLEMSTRIPIAADGLAQIAAAAGQSGIAANEISRFTEAAAKMGTAFDITAEQAGTAMAEMRVAFGFSQDEVEALADKINYLGNTTPNAAAGLTEVVQRIGAIAKISGVSADQLAAMAGSVTSLAPEEVATGLKNLMTRLTAGASATKGMRAAWLDLGFTAEDVAKGMQEDSEAMINAVLSSLRKLPKEDQTAYLNTLFGQEALPVVAQLMTNTELLATNLNAMGDASKYAGSTQAEFEARSATTANQLQLLKDNLNVASIAIGSALLPAINQIATDLMPVISSIATWADKNPELVVQIIAVTGAVTGAILAISGIGLAMAGVSSAISGFSAIFGVAKIAIMALSGPIGLTVMAITGLIMAGALLYQNWDMIKAKATEIWGGIKDAITSKIDGIKSSMSASWDNIKSTTASKAQEAVNAAKNAFNGLPAPIKTVLTVAYNVVKTQIDLIKNAFTTGLNIIKAVVRGDMQGVVNAFKTGMSNAWNIIKTGVSNILNAIRDLGAKLFRMGSDAVDGLVRGLKAKIGEVRNAASELGQAAWGGVKSFLQIRSPSRKMAELGKHTADGLAKGIKDNKKPVISEAQKMAEQAVKAVKDTIATLQRDIALFDNDDPVAAMLWDRANTDKYKGVSSGLFNQAVDLTKQKEALGLADKFKEALKGIQDSINGSVSTELEKWSIALYGGNKELSKLEGGKKLELLNEAANLDFSNLSKEMAKSSIEIDRQVELLGTKSDLDKDMLKIDYEASDLLSKYNFYLERGLKLRYDEFKAIVDANAEKKKGLVLTEREQKLRDEVDGSLSSIRTELLGYGINETDSDKNDYQLADTLERLRQAHEMQLVQQDEFQKLSEIAKQRHADKMAEIENAMYQNRAGLFASASKALLGENSRMYRLMFAIEKGYALQSAWLEHKKSILKAYSETPGSVWAKAAAAAKAAADTGLMTAAIAAVQAPIGQAHDGIMSVPKSGTWNLEKGERVLPAHTAKAMDKKLEQGGKVIIHNYSGEKAEAKQDMDGNTIVVIGKMVNGIVDQKLAKFKRQEQRQGGLFSG